MLGQGLTLVIGFISSKYIYSELGEDALGIIYFSLLLSTILLSAIDLGVSKTTIREIASFKETQPGYAARFIQTFSFYYWIAFLLVLIGFYFTTTTLLKSWIQINTISTEDAGNILLIIGSSSLLIIPKSYLTSICVGMQRMAINNTIDVSASIVHQSGILLLLLNGFGLYKVAIWIALSNCLRLLAYIYFVSRIVPPKSLLPIFSLDVFHKTKSYTSRMAVLSLLLIANKQLDKIIISKLLPIGIFGVYSFAFSALGRTSFISTSMSRAISPTFSELDSIKNDGELKKKFFLFQEMLIVGMLPIYVFVLYFMMHLFGFIFDAEKAKILQLPMFFLVVSFYVSSSLMALSVYLKAVGKPRYIIISNALALCIVTPVMVYLVYNYGIDGASSSRALYFVFIASVMLPNIYKKEFGISMTHWLSLVSKSIILCITIYLPVWIFVYYFHNNNFALLTIGYIFSSIIYSTISFRLSTDGLKKSLSAFITPISRRIVR